MLYFPKCLHGSREMVAFAPLRNIIESEVFVTGDVRTCRINTAGGMNGQANGISDGRTQNKRSTHTLHFDITLRERRVLKLPSAFLLSAKITKIDMCVSQNSDQRVHLPSRIIIYYSHEEQNRTEQNFIRHKLTISF